MVWSTTQSALYNDLSRYYEDGKKAPNPQEIEPQKFEQIIREKSIGEAAKKTNEKCAETKSEGSCENECDLISETRQRSDTRANLPSCPGCPSCHSSHSSHDHPICQSCQYRQGSSQNSLAQLFSDKDMLLIAGLIFLLMKQGADQKLILALVFVLLG